MDLASSEPARTSGRRFLALLTGLVTLGLIAAGALVNARQAALSVPDWPLSYGRWLLIDRWAGNTVYEHTHRLFAVAAGLLLACFLPLLWRGAGKGLRRAIAWVAGLYVAQVLLGGAVVLLRDPPAVAALHVVLAVVAAALVLLLALAPFGPWQAAAVPRRADLLLGARQRRLALWIVGLLVLQVGLGAVSRHPAGREALVVALLGHVAVALVLLVLVPVAAVSIGRRTRGPLRRAAVLLAALFAAQLLVAAPLFVISPEPLRQEWPPPAAFPALHVAHVLLATLLLAVASYLAARLRRLRS